MLLCCDRKFSNVPRDSNFPRQFWGPTNHCHRIHRVQNPLFAPYVLALGQQITWPPLSPFRLQPEVDFARRKCVLFSRHAPQGTSLQLLLWERPGILNACKDLSFGHRVLLWSNLSNFLIVVTKVDRYLWNQYILLLASRAPRADKDVDRFPDIYVFLIKFIELARQGARKSSPHVAGFTWEYVSALPCPLIFFSGWTFLARAKATKYLPSFIRP